MKISIKREQSQAGLSFAEREKFRPQVKKNKLLLLLALLMTAATGAWAQGYNVTFGGFAESEMNTTVNVTSLPYTFTAIGDDAFYPWTVISTSGDIFYNATVTSGGEGKVSANIANYDEMSITVSGPFEGTATIHVTGEDDENRDISCDITVSCEAVGGGSGEEAQTETLLTTIVNTGGNASFKSGNKTFDDKVTVTFSSSVFNDGDEYGWYANGGTSLLTVTGINGYTITSCKFYTKSGTAKTGYTVAGESPSVYLDYANVYTDDSESVNIGETGVTKIEVYGAAAAPTYSVTMKDGVKDADKWTGKVGAATDYQALPLNVVEGAAVSLKFDGTKRVKSVKAVKKASVPDGAINGKFSVNNTGKQVYFAKGNLQAVCTSADNNPSYPETFTWQFAENQWDCVGNNAANNSIDGNGSVSAAGTVDLFGWSTAATTYGIHNSTTASDYSGDFVDWGGTIGTGWRTLTKDEWNYLFMTRESGSKVNGMSPSPDNARYTHATINTDNGTDGIRGMILFPDGVTVNYSDATYWGGINQYSNWNGSTKCTTSQWNALAAKGFVFLPTGGVRNGTTISNSNNNGYYWSSYTASSTNGSAHYTRVVPATEPTTDYDSRKIGISVRLVYDVE